MKLVVIEEFTNKETAESFISEFINRKENFILTLSLSKFEREEKYYPWPGGSRANMFEMRVVSKYLLTITYQIK